MIVMGSGSSPCNSVSMDKPNALTTKQINFYATWSVVILLAFLAVLVLHPVSSFAHYGEQAIW